MSVTVRQSDCHYDSSHHTSIITHDPPYTRFKSIPSSREWEQSRKVKEFRGNFTNCNLLLRALYVSSIYLSDSRHVAPPKSGEEAHVTCGRCDLGRATLNKPRLGLSYMLSRLWDPGGVRSTPNVPRDRSRTLAPSRCPYAPCRGHLVNLTSLRRWQDLRRFHVNLFHGKNPERNNAMMIINGSINVIIPALTRPTLMLYELCFLHIACKCTYNRQSICTSFTVTATSYIQVTQILKLCVGTTSPYKGHTCCPSFLRLLDPTSGLPSNTSRLPKLLHWLCLILLMTLGLRGAPYE